MSGQHAIGEAGGISPAPTSGQDASGVEAGARREGGGSMTGGAPAAAAGSRAGVGPCSAHSGIAGTA